MYPNQNYNYYNKTQPHTTNYNYPNNYANLNNSIHTPAGQPTDNDERFFPFLAPFLLGGIAGAAVAPAFNRPYPYPAPYPMPYPTPYPYPVYRQY